jgi:hypothetical protein
MGQGLYGYRKWLFMQWPFLLEVVAKMTSDYSCMLFNDPSGDRLRDWRGIYRPGQNVRRPGGTCCSKGWSM